jgi:hypothetical protein
MCMAERTAYGAHRTLVQLTALTASCKIQMKVSIMYASPCRCKTGLELW